jgi:hypothetical protein
MDESVTHSRRRLPRYGWLWRTERCSLVEPLADSWQAEAMLFGCLAQAKSFQSSDWSITPLDGNPTYTQIERAWPHVDRGWAYAPWETDTRFGDHVPLKPTPWFGLRDTHDLTPQSKALSDTRTQEYIRWGAPRLPLKGFAAGPAGGVQCPMMLCMKDTMERRVAAAGARSGR